jgi:pimeloyl-ACP methyl ester carboxylesterase
MTIQHIENTSPSIIPTAEVSRLASFGTVYEGEIAHSLVLESETDRTNRFIEAVPRNLVLPDSAIVICGGFTSSREHYAVIQRELALRGERSVYVDHRNYKGYEIGHNAEDIAMTCEVLALNGIKNIVLFGHSRGAAEALEAHQMLRSRESEVEVTDIVLAFPAQFSKHLSFEHARNVPLFAAESVYGFVKDPVRQIRFGAQILRNIFSDLERTAKEAIHLLSNQTAADIYDEIQSGEYRPAMHVIVGMYDGLVPGKLLIKHFEDRMHDSLTVLNTGHIEMNRMPAITDIIHSKVRKIPVPENIEAA